MNITELDEEVRRLRERVAELEAERREREAEVRSYARQHGALFMAYADAKALLGIVVSGDGTKAGNAARARAWLDSYGTLPEWESAHDKGE